MANSDGSSRPLAIRLISWGMLNVSTSPVVIVTSRIHSFSRCRLCGLAVNADVGHAPAGTDQIRRELEGLRHTDRLERDVGTEAVSQLHNP